MSALTVAILGFAHASAEQEAMAAKAGRLLAMAGLRLVVGNLTSTFAHAIDAAQAAGGACTAILEPRLADLDQRGCESVEMLPTQHSKHERLLELAHGGLVIGGGPGTLRLVEGLLAARKPVFGVRDSGGVTAHELADRLPLHNVDEAVGHLVTALAL